MDGHDNTFSEAAHTKDLKPDLEGACVLDGALRWFHRGRVLAVVDEDDPTAASALLTLRVSL